MLASLIRRLRTASVQESTAVIDKLTGLPTRHAVISHLSRSLSKSRNKEAMAMVIIEFSSMMAPVDTAGSDEVLIVQLAQLLRSWISPEHVVGRLRNREFAIVLRGLSMQEVERLADQVVDKVRSDRSLQDRRGQIATIVGVGYSSRADCPASHLMSLSDIALHYARATGRSWHAIVDKTPMSRAA